MKLRIRTNTLRFRLTQTECQHLAQEKTVQSTLRFGPGPEQAWTYGLCVRDVANYGVESLPFVQGADGPPSTPPLLLRLIIPRRDVAKWHTEDAVGLYGFVSFGDQGLTVAIERDFTCLQPRTDEDDDTFPHPELAREL